jgi:hypothetical protein
MEIIILYKWPYFTTLQDMQNFKNVPFSLLEKRMIEFNMLSTNILKV